MERHIEGVLKYYTHDKVISKAIESQNNGIKVLIMKLYRFRKIKKIALLIKGIRDFNQ
ncbi:MAG: hypothetical protein LBE38_12010 [Deltaproteobacteria bacterium]|nr:hypothetical protein [Deltaproteobacteria bacterium]